MGKAHADVGRVRGVKAASPRRPRLRLPAPANAEVSALLRCALAAQRI